MRAKSWIPLAACCCLVLVACGGGDEVVVDARCVDGAAAAAWSGAAEACVRLIDAGRHADASLLAPLIEEGGIWVDYCLGHIALHSRDYDAAATRLMRVCDGGGGGGAGVARACTALADAETFRGHGDDAARALRRALVAAPAHPPALLALGQLLVQRGDMRGAADALGAYWRAVPDWVDSIDKGDLLTTLANAHVALGDVSAAGAWLALGAAHEPATFALRRGLMLLAPSADSAAEMEGWLLDAERALSDAIAAFSAAARDGRSDAVGLRLAAPSRVGGSFLYPAMFQLGSVARVRGLAAAAYLAAFPSLDAASVGVPCARPRGARTVVGFLSRFFYHHPVGRTFSRLIAQLPRADFEVVVFPFPQVPDDLVSRAILRAADRVVWLPELGDDASIVRARILLSAAHLDALVYPEIGMHADTFFQALGRVAPVQVTSTGNSVTSGMGDSIDYYVSYEDSETRGSGAHYVEQLARLSAFHMSFVPPRAVASATRPAFHSTSAGIGVAAAPQGHAATPFFDGTPALEVARAALAFTGDVPPAALAARVARCALGATTFYLSPFGLDRLHPLYDGVPLAVLDGDPCGVLGVLGGEHDAATLLVLRRLLRALSARPLAEQAEALSRLLLLPMTPHAEFVQLLAAADVVIDRYPYGGATTTYEALILGSPVVSTPGPALRGRFTRALLARCGFNDWIVPLPRLAAAAVAVGRARGAMGPAARAQDRARIAEAAAEALEDGASLHEWSRFLTRAVAAARRGIAAAGGGGDDDAVRCDRPAIDACAIALASERPYITVLDPDASSGRPLQHETDGLVLLVLLAGASVGRTAESCVSVDGAPLACFNGSVAPYDAPGYSPVLAIVPPAGGGAAACRGVGAPGSAAARVCEETWTGFVPGACGTARRLWLARFVAGGVGPGPHLLRVVLRAHGRVVAEDERAFRVPAG